MATPLPGLPWVTAPRREAPPGRGPEGITSKTWTSLAAGPAFVLGNSLIFAASVDDANKLVESALAEIKAKGLEAAAKDCNANTGGKWHADGLYVVGARFDGHMVAHSANEKIVGKNMFEAKDAAGKPFVQENIASVKSSGVAKVDLRWMNPEAKKIADAVMVSKRVPGEEVDVGSVAFK